MCWARGWQETPVDRRAEGWISQQTHDNQVSQTSAPTWKGVCGKGWGFLFSCFPRLSLGQWTEAQPLAAVWPSTSDFSPTTSYFPHPGCYEDSVGTAWSIAYTQKCCINASSMSWHAGVDGKLQVPLSFCFPQFLLKPHCPFPLYSVIPFLLPLLLLFLFLCLFFSGFKQQPFLKTMWVGGWFFCQACLSARWQLLWLEGRRCLEMLARAPWFFFLWPL